jgi:hypothetical protein
MRKLLVVLAVFLTLSIVFASSARADSMDRGERDLYD